MPAASRGPVGGARVKGGASGWEVVVVLELGLPRPRGSAGTWEVGGCAARGRASDVAPHPGGCGLELASPGPAVTWTCVQGPGFGELEPRLSLGPDRPARLRVERETRAWIDWWVGRPERKRRRRG